MKFYFLKNLHTTVTFSFSEEKYLWKSIRGISIGNYFIGAIEGHKIDEKSDS